MTRCKVQGAGVMLQRKDCKCNVTKIAKNTSTLLLLQVSTAAKLLQQAAAEDALQHPLQHALSNQCGNRTNESKSRKFPCYLNAMLTQSLFCSPCSALLMLQVSTAAKLLQQAAAEGALQHPLQHALSNQCGSRTIESRSR
jgi:hypothetical protein